MGVQAQPEIAMLPPEQCAAGCAAGYPAGCAVGFARSGGLIAPQWCSQLYELCCLKHRPPVRELRLQYAINYGQRRIFLRVRASSIAEHCFYFKKLRFLSFLQCTRDAQFCCSRKSWTLSCGIPGASSWSSSFLFRRFSAKWR